MFVMLIFSLAILLKLLVIMTVSYGISTLIISFFDISNRTEKKLFLIISTILVSILIITWWLLISVN